MSLLEGVGRRQVETAVASGLAEVEVLRARSHDAVARLKTEFRARADLHHPAVDARRRLPLRHRPPFPPVKPR